MKIKILSLVTLLSLSYSTVVADYSGTATVIEGKDEVKMVVQDYLQWE